MTLMPLRLFPALWLVASLSAAAPPGASYTGPETCALCHKTIAGIQQQSAMAKTWGGHFPTAWPRFSGKISEGSGLEYKLQSQGNNLMYLAEKPAGPKLTVPVETVVGGERHGLGFLFKVEEIGGFPLERRALVQARYFWSFKNGGELVLAPGLSTNTPWSIENILGLVLSPGFEKQCLTCHGQPNTLGAGKLGGVRCESCHGPGSQHLPAAGKGRTSQGIVNPGKLTPDESIQVCAQCHAGFGQHIDPAPDDLLIANQVQALRSSECFIQSGRSFSCMSCHDPHSDSRDNEAVTTRTCLDCHSKTLAQRAAVCPVNASARCTGCHMPSIDVGPLHLVDHEIRVHPEQNVAARIHDDSLRSQREPVREFLRVIENDDRGKIVEAKQRIVSGSPFYDVAREVSQGSAASIGGFWGDKQVSTLDPALIPAVKNLHYGELSEITISGGRWYLIQRMPRDFKWQADQLQRSAEALFARGELSEAIGKSQEALKIYPHFRRALTFIGTTLSQGGNPQRAVEVLGVTTRLYPTDAISLFARAVVLEELNRTEEAIETYRRVLALEPEFLDAYAKLGAALGRKGDPASALTVFRQGLQIDPLAAELYHDVSFSLARQGDTAAAERSAAIAALLDPSTFRN